jgi:probable addiction module antidote protein
MPKATKTYAEWRVEKLSDPKRAARYLNAAKRDSTEAFLHAVKNVIQANQVARVAREAGISRESVYRSFSAEGNPTFDTLSSVLEALNIGIEFVPAGPSASEGESGSSSNKLQTKPGFPSAVPSSANLATAGLMIGGYDSGTALGTSAPISDLDTCVFAYTSQDDPVFSAGSLQAEHSLPNATLGEELGFLPGFLHHQQQMRPTERSR